MTFYCVWHNSWLLNGWSSIYIIYSSLSKTASGSIILKEQLVVTTYTSCQCPARMVYNRGRWCYIILSKQRILCDNHLIGCNETIRNVGVQPTDCQVDVSRVGDLEVCNAYCVPIDCVRWQWTHIQHTKVRMKKLRQSISERPLHVVLQLKRKVEHCCYYNT